MSSGDRVTVDERRKYLRRMQNRYRGAGCKERGQLLDEMEAATELHRKSLIRLMSSDLERQPRRRLRGRTYGPEVDDASMIVAVRPPASSSIPCECLMLRPLRHESYDGGGMIVLMITHKWYGA